jgi:hypothetical protein
MQAAAGNRDGVLFLPMLDVITRGQVM